MQTTGKSMNNFTTAITITFFVFCVIVVAIAFFCVNFVDLAKQKSEAPHFNFLLALK